MCIYVCVWGCLDKYISVATWPPQTKIPGSAPVQVLIIFLLHPLFSTFNANMSSKQGIKHSKESKHR